MLNTIKLLLIPFLASFIIGIETSQANIIELVVISDQVNLREIAKSQIIHTNIAINNNKENKMEITVFLIVSFFLFNPFKFSLFFSNNWLSCTIH